MINEGLKDFLAGATTIALGLILTALLVLLWPLITVIGWLVIALLILALGIVLFFTIVMIVGRLVRSAYKKR